MQPWPGSSSNSFLEHCFWPVSALWLLLSSMSWMATMQPWPDGSVAMCVDSVPLQR